MPHYELDAAAMTAATRKKLAETPMEIVFDPAEGRVLARPQKKLARAQGVREVPDADFEALLGAARSAGPPARARARRGGARLEASTRWKVAASSPRKAGLHWMAAGGDQQALGITMGEGRGDRVEIIRTLPKGSAPGSVSLEVRPGVDTDEEFAVAVILTSGRERPWLERGPQPVEPNAWTTLTYDFSDVDERKRARADQLMVVLHTDADQGLCLIRNVALLV